METKNWLCCAMSALVVVVAAPVRGQQLVEPIRSELQYIPQGIKYLGSNNPIPDQHIKCLVHLDHFFDRTFARLNRHNERDDQWKRVVKGRENFSRLDWGISARVNYPEWEKELRAELPAAKKDLEEVRAELKEYEERVRQMMLRATTMTGPALASMTAALAMGHSAVRAASDGVLYSEESVDYIESAIAFTQCVSANALPPTVP